MTVLRSREVLPRPPLPKIPRKRPPPPPPPPPPPQPPSPSPSLPPLTSIGPRTPARVDTPSASPRVADAAAVAAASPAAPTLGLVAGPRRSPRLASRTTETASTESKGSAMGPDERGGRRKKGKRARAAGVGGSGSRSPNSEEEKEGGAGGFDLNFPAVELPLGNGRHKGGEGAKVVDLTVCSRSGSEESEDELPWDPVSESRPVRRRMEVIEIESDTGGKEVVMAAYGGRRYSSSEKGKGILIDDDDAPMSDKAGFFEFLHEAGSHVGEPENDDIAGEDRMQGGRGRRYTEEEKGKRTLVVEEDWLTLGGHEGEASMVVAAERMAEECRVENDPAYRRRESDRMKAREVAPRFAFFKPEEEEENEERDSSDTQKDDPADWPGPFSTAVKIIEDREKRLESRKLNSVSSASKSSELKIEWIPSFSRIKLMPSSSHIDRPVPSLRDLSLRILSENATEVESLEGIPDDLRRQLSWHVCKSRKMDEHVFDLFVRGSPTEIRITDCSWATDGQFGRIFDTVNTDQLAVLQLDLCGRCLPDYILSSTLARSPDNLPSLTTISLKGAYRLSDDGLNALASSAPHLRSINLGQCSFITSAGIISLVEKLNLVLRELYLDDCHIDPMLILPALKNLKKLEVLSVAGIESVTNKFVCGLVSVHGASMKELVFTGCKHLSVTSVKEIGENCPQLRSLDLRELTKLNDSALGHLANGCTSLQKLMLRHNSFSDKAVAALLEASGSSLAELSLNNIKEVSNFTAEAISIRCSLNLRILDLSFCRKMTDEGLGLIVDSCSYLRILKVFGCRQITSTFLEGHSNGNVTVIGLEGSILQHLEMPGFS